MNDACVRASVCACAHESVRSCVNKMTKQKENNKVNEKSKNKTDGARLIPHSENTASDERKGATRP